MKAWQARLKPSRHRALAARFAAVALSIGVKFAYGYQIRRFWKEIRDDWRAHEQMLAEDPRNGLTE